MTNSARGKGAYLDYQATTPLAPEARAAMLPWLGPAANPHSIHAAGRRAAAAVAAARDAVAALLPADGQLIFTSGATEAINLALAGAYAAAPAGRDGIVTVATEHAAVLDSCAALARAGAQLTTVPVNRDGLIDLDALAAAIDERTALVAAMLVNNEIGVIQPVAAIAALARAAGAAMLCDAVQGLGRVPLPAGPTLIALSAHKLHGPVGIGALWVAEGQAIAPGQHGGGQEGGLRSGTLSPALAAGFGAAAALLPARRAADAAHVERLWRIATARLAGWQINGSIAERYRGNLNIRRDGLDAARLMSELRGVALSVGSACASGSGRPSHVLAALGLSDSEARSSLRLGFGRYTEEAELIAALDAIAEAAARQEQTP